MAGLTRVEYLFLVPVAVMLQFGLAAGSPRGTATLSVLHSAWLVHGLAHLVLIPTHYRDVISSQLLAAWRILRNLDRPAVVASIVVAAALVFLVRLAQHP